jgi:antitoxin component of MazEF toxin-antitoxin module
MTAQLKLLEIGDSLGLILPKELSDLLHVKEGDTLHAVIDPQGGRAAHALRPAVRGGYGGLRADAAQVPQRA